MDLRDYCNSKKNPEEDDFKHIPTGRIFRYNNRCYDLEMIIYEFDRRCFDHGYYFHITPGWQLSFSTMKKIAQDTIKYNAMANRDPSEREFYIAVGYTDKTTTNTLSAGPIKVSDFMNLLFHDVSTNSPSTFCMYIITYDMRTRSKTALLYLKVIYIHEPVTS